MFYIIFICSIGALFLRRRRPRQRGAMGAGLAEQGLEEFLEVAYSNFNKILRR
jgi:hypothetical protein